MSQLHYRKGARSGRSPTTRYWIWHPRLSPMAACRASTSKSESYRVFWLCCAFSKRGTTARPEHFDCTFRGSFRSWSRNWVNRRLQNWHRRWTRLSSLLGTDEPWAVVGASCQPSLGRIPTPKICGPRLTPSFRRSPNPKQYMGETGSPDLGAGTWMAGEKIGGW